MDCRTIIRHPNDRRIFSVILDSLISFLGRREVDMNVAVHEITRFRNGPGVPNTFGRFLHGGLFALSAGVALLCGNSAALAGPCAMRIIQFERQIAIDLPVRGSGPMQILPQSRDAQLHHQPSLDTVVQAQHFGNKVGNDEIDKAWKADNDGDIDGCNRALIEARRLYYFRD
jgi:hypothetical protein